MVSKRTPSSSDSSSQAFQPGLLTGVRHRSGNRAGAEARTGAALDHKPRPDRPQGVRDKADAPTAVKIGLPPHGGGGQLEPYREGTLGNALVPHRGVELQLGRSKGHAECRPMREP